MTTRIQQTVDGEVVYDNGDSARPEYDPDVATVESSLARLRELYAKGWQTLTASEKAEVPKLVTDVLAAR